MRLPFGFSLLCLVLPLGCNEGVGAPSSGAASLEAAQQSDTQLVPYLTAAEARATARAYESRHPGWRVTNIGELTGSIVYAWHVPSPDGTAVVPQAPVTNDDLVRRVRDFLLADADLHGIDAAD